MQTKKISLPKKLNDIIPDDLLNIKVKKSEVSNDDLEKYIKGLLDSSEQFLMEDEFLESKNVAIKHVLCISHPDTKQHYLQFITIFKDGKKKRYVNFFSHDDHDSEDDEEQKKEYKKFIRDPNWTKLKPGEYKEFIQLLVMNGLVLDYSMENHYRNIR